MSLRQVLETAAAFAVEHPDRAWSTEAARCVLVDDTSVEVSAGPHAVNVSWPRRLGGTGAAPSPTQYFLAALGSSVAITYRLWSEKLDIPFDHLRVDVRADLDARGLLGLAGGVLPGSSGVHVTIRLAGPESHQRYEALGRAAEGACALLDLLRHPGVVEVGLEVDD